MLNEIERGQLSIDAVQCFTEGEGSLSIFPKLIKRVIAERVWERRSHHGRLIELPNLRALITEKPIRGWGQDPKKIEAVIRDDAEALAMYQEAMQGESGRPMGGESRDNITILTPHGTSRSYALTRLKRQAPKLYSRVVAGELSAHAAAVKAGFRRKTITHPLSVDGFARAIARHLTDDERKALAERIGASNT